MLRHLIQVEPAADDWVMFSSVFATEEKEMSVNVIKKAFQATEEGFLSIVTKQWPMNPQIAAVGSCCLVAVICNGKLYIANLGDSRAVLGRLVRSTGKFFPFSCHRSIM